MLDLSHEAQDIRRRMAETRRDLQVDARDVKDSASSMTDWRNYVRLYPWPAVGLAVAAGYLVIPASKRDRAPLRAESPRHAAAGSFWFNTLLRTLSGVAVRLAQSVALQHVEHMFAHRGTAQPNGHSASTVNET